MSRRLVNLTLDTLEDLPRPCRQCVFWELDPVAAERACAAGDPGPGEGGVGLADAARVGLLRQAGLRRRHAGRVRDVRAAGVRARGRWPSRPRPVSRRRGAADDGARGGRVRRRRAGPDAGPGRRPRPDQARHQGDRGVRRREVRRRRTTSAAGCVAPADFFLSVGFKTVRPHPRYPAAAPGAAHRAVWKSDVEYALEKLLGSMSPETPAAPGPPGPGHPVHDG